MLVSNNSINNSIFLKTRQVKYNSSAYCNLLPRKDSYSDYKYPNSKYFFVPFNLPLINRANVNFTANTELTDEEFLNRLKEFELKFRKKNIPQSIIEEFLYESNISKENLKLAELLYFDKTIDTSGLDIPKTLLFTDIDNEQFAIQLCKHPKYPRKDIPDTLLFTTKDTIPIAQKLLDVNYLHREKIYMALTDFTQDPVAGIAAVCGNYYDEYCNKNFPNNLKSIFSTYVCDDDVEYLKRIYESTKFSSKEIRNIFANMTTPGLVTFKWMNSTNKKDSFSMIKTLETIKKYSKYFSNEEIYNLISRVEYQQKLVNKNPENYGHSNNIVIQNPLTGRIAVSNDSSLSELFGARYGELMLLASILDKESMDVLFRKRVFAVSSTLKKISSLSDKYLNILKNLEKCVNIGGKRVTPQQKIDFIDIMCAYSSAGLSTDKIERMISSGVVNISALQEDILKQILKNVTGYSDYEIDKIPKNKLLNWNVKFIHTISQELLENTENTQCLRDIIKVANKGNFLDYINTPSNIYGEYNFRTKKLFDMYGIDYNKWLNPPNKNNVHFVAIDENEEQLSQFAEQLAEDIETLRAIVPEVKQFIDKRLPYLISNGKVVIPQHYTRRREKMENLLIYIDINLEKVWKKAENTLNCSKDTQANNDAYKKVQNALRTLTVRDHMKQRLSDIKNVPNIKIAKPVDYTIKMWDRNPSKDLFQGNYSTCCIGMGRSNGRAMTTYLLNSAFNMIEIVDNKTGETIGNALCYFVSGENAKPVFVVDNIEINNTFKLSDKTAIKLRDSLCVYVKNLLKDITSDNDIRIILGCSYNDVPTGDLVQGSSRIGLIGDVSADNVYLDLYGGWINKANIFTERKYCVLN